MIHRLIAPNILEYIDEKIILISGPRQTGKTTLSKSLIKSFDYLNYDNDEDKLDIFNKSWDRTKELIIFDELHKKKDWKRFLKGVYDTENLSPKIVVTGSAKLDAYKKVGDSLAGRYFRYRLHPFDLKELVSNDPTISKEETLTMLMTLSGFPEPFLKGSEKRYRLWHQTHQDIILRQDLIDLERVTNISTIETLIQLLAQRVGSPVSYASFARDLQVDPKTIKRWLGLLENLYIIYRVTPYSRNIARSLLKEPKYYFFDIAHIKDEGAKFENLVANAILKELHFIQDTQGYKTNLHYIQNKQGKEVDFLTVIDTIPTHLIESKLSDTNLSSNLAYFNNQLPNTKQIQIVKNAKKIKTFPNSAIVYPAIEWLSTVELS